MRRMYVHLPWKYADEVERRCYEIQGEGKLVVDRTSTIHS